MEPGAGLLVSRSGKSMSQGGSELLRCVALPWLVHRYDICSCGKKKNPIKVLLLSTYYVDSTQHIILVDLLPFYRTISQFKKNFLSSILFFWVR